MVPLCDMRAASLALLAAWDVGDPVCTLCGMGLGERRAGRREHPGAALSLRWRARRLPCVPVLGLPMGVAGAARPVGGSRPRYQALDSTVRVSS